MAWSQYGWDKAILIDLSSIVSLGDDYTEAVRVVWCRDFARVTMLRVFDELGGRIPSLPKGLIVEELNGELSMEDINSVGSRLNGAEIAQSVKANSRCSFGGDCKRMGTNIESTITIDMQ
ncbi:hypothetical protein HAX54_039368 [Datura stramonium]|uniref:Uncharacterized protein n=1 Tax=Datura stramonium TaxID=4076 RepID=A0ABS8VMI5_DATST|nr:hypothetical protein [Datura stramonium]